MPIDNLLIDGGGQGTGSTTSTGSTSTTTVSVGSGGPTVVNTIPNGNGTYTIIWSDGSQTQGGTPQTYSWTNPLTGAVQTFNTQAELTAAQTAAGITSSANNLASSQAFSAQQSLANQQFQQSMYAQSVADTQMFARQSAFDILMSEFTKYGLGSLVDPLKSLLTQNVSPAEFSIRLRETDAYKQRFIANDARIANGLRALGPAEYLANEDAYRQTLRAYGLTAFDNDAYVRKFLENDMSPAELNTRVVDAVQRVQMADPSIKNTIKQYYGLSDTELTAYMLDPKNQLPEIERKVQAGEIGGAASLQGFNVGMQTAEELAAYGVTQNQARQGYQTIGEMLPGATRLSDIYGSTMEGYGQTQAEQEVFKGTASAKRARERLIGREVGTFSGQTGVSRSSLESGSKGNF